MNRPLDEPTDEEIERLAEIGKTTIQQMRDRFGMGRTLPKGLNTFIFTGGHPGSPRAENWFFGLVNYTRRDD